MTVNECKEWLNSYRKLVGKIKYKEMRINFLNERITGCGGGDLSAPKVQGGQHVSQSQMIAMKLDLEESYISLVKQANDLSQNIFNEIENKVEHDLNKQVLVLYYLELIDIEKIAKTINYTVGHIYKARRNGINELVKNNVVNKEITENEIRSNN